MTSLARRARGKKSEMREIRPCNRPTLNVPNWNATANGDGVTIQWNDFEKLTF